jgi:hypothetical protein
MVGPLINFILPLVFIASIGLLLYSLVLLILGLVKKSRALRRRSFLFAIGPLIYVVGMLSLFRYLKWDYNRKMMPTIAGTYQHTFNDTFRVVYQIGSDNTYSIKSPTIDAFRTWAIESNSLLITFFDPDKKVLTRSLLKLTPTKPSLLFLNKKDTVEMIKQD